MWSKEYNESFDNLIKNDPYYAPDLRRYKLLVWGKAFDDDEVWRSIGLMWRSKSPRQEEFGLLGEMICVVSGFGRLMATRIQFEEP